MNDVTNKAGDVTVSGGVIRIDGRQAYWFDSTKSIAWNSTREWTLTAEQVALLVAKAPASDASTPKTQGPWWGFEELPGGVKTY